MRILIATVTAGSGHLQAAIALEEAWRVVRPTDPVEHLDALDFAPRFYKKIYEKGYPKLVNHAPEVYGLAFRKTDNPARVKKLTRLRRTFAKLTTRPFVERLLASQPDAVICTHYLPLVVLGGLKHKARRWRSPLNVCVVTDFEAHAFWMEPCVGLYCVAAEETKARLVARGAAPENVVVTGIPISAKFERRPELGRVQAELGLAPVATPIQTVVVCGRNEKLR